MARKKISESNWWARRWNGVLDSYGWENRLARGKSYARSGRVTALDISSGAVAAKVKGSRPRPYSVKIGFDKLTGRDWDAVLKVMSERASYTALLLAGEMPKNIEDAFKEASVPLFPGEDEISMRCSCPDWALPCKHIAAVFYILGDMFDQDPFLLFHLRGRSKELIMKGLRELRVDMAGPSSGDAPPGPESIIPPEKCIEKYWTSGEGLTSFKVNMAPPKINGSLLKTHGPPAFINDKKAFSRLMEECYEEVSRKAMEVAYSLEDGSDT